MAAFVFDERIVRRANAAMTAYAASITLRRRHVNGKRGGTFHAVMLVIFLFLCSSMSAYD